jgi:hypothetical protein
MEVLGEVQHPANDVPASDSLCAGRPPATADGSARRMGGQGGAGAHVCSIHAGSGARAFMSLMRPCTCAPPETSGTRALGDTSGVRAVGTRWRRHARAAGAGPPAFLELSRTGRRGWRGMRGAGGASSRGVRGEGDGPERP